MSYRGWNREELLRAGVATKEASNNLHHNITERTTTSFTLINQRPATFPALNPHKPRVAGLDGNSLYDLPEDAVSQVPAPKRRKRAPMTPAQSKNALSRTLTRVWDLDADDDAVQQHHGDNGEQEGPQLTTPPDYVKRKKRKDSSVGRKTKTKQTELFHDPPPITKATSSRITPETPRSKPVSNHSGWTTTEDEFKLAFNGPAQTTLDKLAAFRFKAPSAEHIDDQPSGFTHQHQFDDVRRQSSRNQPRDELPSQEQVYASPNYGALHSNNSFFDKAVFNTNFKPAPTTEKGIDAEDFNARCRPRENNAANNNYNILERLSDVESRTLAGNNSLNEGLLLHHHLSYTRDQPLEIDNVSVVSQHIHEYDKPTSSEAVTLRHLLNDTDNIVMNVEDVVLLPQTPSQNTHDVPIDRHMVDNSKPGQSGHRSLVRDVIVPSTFPASQLQKIGDQLGLVEVLPACYSVKNDLRRDSAELEAERSDAVHPQPVGPSTFSQGNLQDITPKDYNDNADFDEGLDDKNLHAIMPDTIFPDTPIKGPQGQHNTNRQASQAQIDRSTAIPISDGDVSSMMRVDVTSQGSPKGMLRSSTKLSSPPTMTASDDEFPMDESEEEKILKLPELRSGFDETFAPPPSLQYAFDDESVTREVYDSSLQFSPPKLQGSDGSSRKMAHGHTTNLTRHHAISPGVEPRSMAEEEDWTFINSNVGAEKTNNGAVSVSHQSPQATVPNVTDFSHEVLSSPVLPVRTLAANRSTTRPSTASPTITEIHWAILDDSHEYLPLKAFARPGFPAPIRDHSPVIGLSAHSIIRTCFRIGEMIQEGARCNAVGQDAVIELFARATFSSREAGTTKQHFQFADLFHDRPPFPNGILANYKSTGLAESESKVFIGEDGERMARCLGRLKKNVKNAGWLLHILNIRGTDWEEIRWTKRIVGTGLMKSGKDA